MENELSLWCEICSVFNAETHPHGVRLAIVEERLKIHAVSYLTKDQAKQLGEWLIEKSK